eukprot:46755-Pyramimonas_sp.AAC.1
MWSGKESLGPQGAAAALACPPAWLACLGGGWRSGRPRLWGPAPRAAMPADGPEVVFLVTAAPGADAALLRMAPGKG